MRPSQLIVAPLVVVAGFLVAAPAQPPAPAPAAQPDNLYAALEVFRSDLNTSKVRTLNQAMRLTAPEAAKFWPIYRRYEAELTALGDERIALIRKFVALHARNTLTDNDAETLADRWLATLQDRLDLWKKYHKEIGTAVSPVRAAQFLQVEHQIALLIDINIAAEMPDVGLPEK